MLAKLRRFEVAHNPFADGNGMGDTKKPPKVADLPPVDAAELQRAFRRALTKKRPPGGWPGKPPKDVQAEPDDEAGDGH